MLLNLPKNRLFVPTSKETVYVINFFCSITQKKLTLYLYKQAAKPSYNYKHHHNVSTSKPS